MQNAPTRRFALWSNSCLFEILKLSDWALNGVQKNELALRGVVSKVCCSVLLKARSDIETVKLAI